MKLSSIKAPEGQVYAPSCGCHYSDESPEDHTHLSIPASDLHRLWGWNGLTEATYKEIGTLIDGNFLNQRIRTKALESAIFEKFDDNVMVFRVKSSEYESNGITYQTLIQFDQWDEIGQDSEFNANEKARMLLWTSDVKMYCSDPSFLYYYQWVATQYEVAIYHEERRPQRMNKDERGIACKHLNLVLSVLPWNMGKIAAEMKAQFGDV